MKKKLNHFPRKLLAVQTLAVVAMAWNPLTTAASFKFDLQYRHQKRCHHDLRR